MEEASGVDLDWFWRGWFYTTDHVDISLDQIYQLRLDTKNPDIDLKRRRQEEQDKPGSLFVELNKAEGRETWVERNGDVRDFYDKNDQFTVTNKDRNSYNSWLDDLEDWERKTLDRALKEDKNYYVLNFSNKGGLVMPILLQLTFKDGSVQDMQIPAEIWRKSSQRVSKLIVTDKELVSAVIDPKWLTADTDIENNHYPRQIIQSRVEAFKREKDKDRVGMDLMNDSKTKLKDKKEKKD